MDQVTKIVKSGFNRGDGGRVRFRSFLQENTEFVTIIDTVLLDGALTSPIHDTPDPAPTVSPTTAQSFEQTPVASTMEPSRLPTQAPSIDYTLSPSSFPSSIPTTSALTDSETMVPSAPSSKEETISPSQFPYPSILQTEEPSPLPSSPVDSPVSNNVPNSSKSNKSANDRQPLILGAIAGGVATIIVSCFFIFCVWFPFCTRKPRTPNNGTIAQRRRLSVSSQSSGTSNNVKTMIPGVLTLDEDARSLANTTVTQGDMPVKSPRVNFVSTSKRKSAQENVSMLDSFDESSIYTTTLPNGDIEIEHSSQGSNQQFQSPTRVIEDTTDTMHANGSSDQANTTPIYTFTENSELKEESSAPRHNEDSKAHDDMPETTAFDPYHDSGDDSSFDFGSSIALSDPSFGPSMKVKDATVSISSTSTKTKRIENLLAQGDSVPANSSWPSGPEEEKQNTPNNNKPSLNSARDLESNNSLLRSILQDAALLASKASPSTRSRISLQSAPSRLLNKIDQTQNVEGIKPVRLHDLFLKKYEHKQSDDAISSSRSVGAINYPRSNMKFLSFEQFQNGNELVSPSSSDLSLSEPTRETLGALPRSSKLGAGKHVDEESSEETAGILGISSHHPVNSSKMDDNLSNASSDWLADAPTHRLGRRYREKDETPMNHHHFEKFQQPTQYSSLSKSVDSSNGSKQSSRRSEKSWVEDTNSEQDPSRSSTADPMIDGQYSHEGRRKGMGTSLPSLKTLERDLMRLETQVSTVAHILDGDIFTASSISASSAGASRSTLSSRPPLAVTRKKRLVVVVAPPGKIGVVLANKHDGRGTVVSEVRPSSSLKGLLSPGDKLSKYSDSYWYLIAVSFLKYISFSSLNAVAVDDQDVTKMVVSQITSMMAARSAYERRLTVIPSPKSPFIGTRQESWK
jgi:hypothetical protein